MQLKSIGNFIEKWIQSWKTKPDFIIKKKSSSLTRQISKKFSFLNAFVSGSLGVQTLLSVLVGIAGITSIVVYDIVLNPESPLSVGNFDSSDSETDSKKLLEEFSYLLSSQPETEFVAEPTDTEIETEPVAAVTDDVVIVSKPDDDVFTEISPPTGSQDIIVLFILLSLSYISTKIILKK